LELEIENDKYKIQEDNPQARTPEHKKTFNKKNLCIKKFVCQDSSGKYYSLCKYVVLDEYVM
jgi:hypothetical protein